MFKIDWIDGQKYFSYSFKEIDSKYHRKIFLIKELDDGPISFLKTVSINPKNGTLDTLDWNENSNEDIYEFLDKIEKSYQNYSILKIEKKNLKINNIWGRLWEEKKEVKMVQAL